MTELETMQRAKHYMDMLARGIDPITNREITEDSVLNNVRLVRCFFYVADVLGQVIANGGAVEQREKTMAFSITAEQISCVPIREYPVRITEFADSLYQAAGNPNMKRPGVTKITDWLMTRSLMTKVLGADGKSHRVPTDKGLQMGMSTRLRKTRDGEYQAVYYDCNMQRFLLENLQEILSEK